MPDAGQALRAAAAVGPYFAVDLHPQGSPRAQGSPSAAEPPSAAELLWRPFAELVEDAEVLRRQVASVRAALARRTGLDVDAVEERATASLHSLALAARLIAPTFAAAVLTGTVPALEVDRVRWREAEGGPIPIAFLDPPAASAQRPDEATDPLPEATDPLTETADLLHAHVLQAVVAPLVGAFGARFHLSAKVLWGNVASAVGGAATMLAAVGEEPAQRASRLAQDVVERGSLRGHGRYVRPWPERPEQYFVRHSCCLFYRIPGGGTCGDCVLVRDDARLLSWREQAGQAGAVG